MRHTTHHLSSDFTVISLLALDTIIIIIIGILGIVIGFGRKTAISASFQKACP